MWWPRRISARPPMKPAKPWRAARWTICSRPWPGNARPTWSIPRPTGTESRAGSERCHDAATLAPSDHEARDHGIEVHRQARQLMAGGTGLVGTGGRLGRQVADIHQVAVHFTGDLGLLFRGTGNHQVALVDQVDRLGDLLQGHTGGTGRFQGTLGPLVALLHRLHGLTGAILDTGDHLLDLLGRLLGTMGQRPYFIGHHRETASGL